VKDYQRFIHSLENTRLVAWQSELDECISQAFSNRRHGKMGEWLSWLSQLPEFTPSSITTNQALVTIGDKQDINDVQRAQLERVLRLFHPWRKGPFDIFGTVIDTEWHSDWKWDRLREKISPLQDRLVLDVGCGSGYHCWRMQGEGAKMVVGIDPTMLYVMQFLALKGYVPDHAVHVLPLRSDELPVALTGFDSVFSMGVLYHCRSPFDHLLELKSRLRSGGELILETLIVDGQAGHVLVPEGRYAKMRNVWFIPSCETLVSWLRRCGFKNIKVVDVSTTSIEEQRATSWMNFESLKDFLDPDDSRLTIEGYPAPVRAVFVATV